MKQYFPHHSMRRGVLAGSVLTILITAGVLAATHVADAKPFDENGGSMTVAEVTPSPDPTTGFFSPGAASGAAATPAATPTAAPAPATSVQKQKYVALGDSVAAGLGLAAPSGPAGFDTVCGRSPQAYGYTVGKQLGFDTKLIACSGATTGDLSTQQGVSGPNPPAQLSAAFSGGVPKLISITAGANDIYWQRYIQKCYAAICGTSADTTVANGAIALMKAKYQIALENIRVRSALAGSAVPTVVMTGYYDPVSAACSSNPDISKHLTKAELAWLSSNVGKLNQAISSLASSYGSFARYAPVDFTGHDLCSSAPWIQGLSATAPVHPTAAGQQAIARSVIQAAKR